MNRLLRILVSPRCVFDEIREQTPYMLPMWSILIVGFGCFALMLVDFESYYAFMAVLIAPFIALWGSIWSLLIIVGWSGYYWFSGKILKIDINFRDWFGFVCWTAVPAILGSVAGLLILQFSNLDPVDFFSSYPWYGWFGMTSVPLFGLPIPLIWTSFIAVCGYMSWTGKSLATSLVVVAIPIVVGMMLRLFPIAPAIADVFLSR